MGVLRIGYVLSLLVALVAADGLISQFLVRSELGQEANPFLVNLVADGNFLGIKVAGGLLCGLVLWDVYKQRQKLAVVSSLGFVALYTGIVLWNLYMFFIGQV